MRYDTSVIMINNKDSKNKISSKLQEENIKSIKKEKQN